MRNLLFFPRLGLRTLLLSGMMTMAGCYPDDFDKASWGPEPELELSSPGVTLQPVGGSESVTITTNYEEWTATVAEAGRAWCSVEQSGTTLTVTATANPDEKERTTVISVVVGKGKKETKEIAVTQLGTAPRIVADPPAVGLPLEGGNASVKVTTNLTSWTPSVAVGGDWCSAVREGDRLTVSAGSYGGKQQREGLITLSGEGESGARAVTTVKVIQLGSDPVLNVSDPGAFGAQAGSQTLVVMTNLPDWEVTVPSTASWCRAEKGGTSLTLQVDANEGATGRRCELLLTAGSSNGMLKKNIVVVQLGNTAELILSSASVTFDGEESIQSITVFTEEAWTAETEAEWCTLLPGDQTLTMYASKNPSTTEGRRGTVNIRAGSLSQTLEIVQQPDITLALSADTLSLELEGGTQSVTVVTNQTAWSVMVPDTVDWCSAATEGNQLTVTAVANGGAPRETMLTVLAGPEGAQKSVLLPVRQEGVASDRDVLIAFYRATGGDNWTHNDNWCSERPLSEWYGVTTAMIDPGTKAGEAVERVIRLEMSGEYIDGLSRGNNLVGILPPVIGKLTELTYLELYNNPGLSGNIPCEIGLLTKLQTLGLQENSWSGTLPEELGNLSELNYLGIASGNFDEQPLPDWLWKLTKLHTIRMRCKFTGVVPETVTNLTELTELDLASNQLSGSIPAGLGNLTGLKILYLGYNQFTGPIPATLGNLTNLTDLYLNNNRLTGSIPPELGRLTNLENLDLSGNQLSGSIPVELGNLTKLTQLYLFSNLLTGSIPAELGNLTQLTILNLCENQLSGSIPPELGNLTKLKWLLLQNNNLSGRIPPELGQLVNLQGDEWGHGGLQLAGNRLTGSIPPEVQALPNWESFDPGVNILPQQDGYGITDKMSDRDILVEFYKATGGDNWTDNTNWCSDKPLNEWYGVTTTTVQSSTGETTERVSKLTLSGTNGMQGNNLIGKIPPAIGQLTELRTLDLQYNQLSGSIPPELGNLTQLDYLLLGHNQLTGSIPSELGNTGAGNLTLSYNQLSGSIPPELSKLCYFGHMYLDHNQLTGSIPPELGKIERLITLQLNDNQLSGPIPPELGNLGYMVIFYLANNNLTGTIPDSFGKLSAVEFFTISNNRLSGVISKEAKMAHWANFNYEDIYPQQEGYGFSLENSEGSLDNFEDVEW